MIVSGIDVAEGPQSERLARALASLLHLKDATEEELLRGATPIDVALAFAHITRAPYFANPEQVINVDLVSHFGRKDCESFQCVPLFSKDRHIGIAVANPLNPHARRLFEGKAPNYNIHVFVSPLPAIKAALGTNATGANIDEVSYEGVKKSSVTDRVREIDLTVPPPEVGPMEAIYKILQEAIESKASDIHFVTEHERFYYELRIDGDITQEVELPWEYRSNFEGILINFAGREVDEKNLPSLDGRMSVKTNTNRVNMRFHRHAIYRGFHIVVRNLDTSNVPQHLGKGGIELNPVVHKWLLRVLDCPTGIVFLAGVTGSGKTTTTAAMMRAINKTRVNIMTLDNPVEIEIPGVKHCQLDDAKLFEPIFEGFMRSDPDYIVPGEVRDFMSARIAMQAAITGHVVFTSIHASSASRIPQRVADWGIKIGDLAQASAAFMSQRLVKCLCPHCSRGNTVTIDTEMVETYSLPPAWRGQSFKTAKPGGCPACRNRGYSGRRPILEIIPVNDEVRDLLGRPDTTARTLEIFCNQELKIPTVREMGLELWKEGVTDLNALKDVINMTI